MHNARATYMASSPPRWVEGKLLQFGKQLVKATFIAPRLIDDAWLAAKGGRAEPHSEINRQAPRFVTADGSMSEHVAL